jgi:hypothetical protein
MDLKYMTGVKRLKRLFFIIPFIIFLSACSGSDEASKTNDQINEPENNSANGNEDVLKSLPDFPIPLATFVEKYNSFISDGNQQIPSDIEFKEFDDKGYYKLLVGEEAFELTAQFDQNKKFKRLLFNINSSTDESETTEKAFTVLTTVCSVLNIDQNYFIDFLDSGEIQTEFKDNGFNVNILFEKDLGFFNVSIEADQ